MDYLSEFPRFQHVDAVSPAVEVPSHFDKTARAESDNKRSVRLSLDRLVRMELKLSGNISHLRPKPPDNIVLVVILVHSESPCGELLKVKAMFAFERTFQHFDHLDLWKAKDGHLPPPFVKADEVIAMAVEEPVGVNCTVPGHLFRFGAVRNPDLSACLYCVCGAHPPPRR